MDIMSVTVGVAAIAYGLYSAALRIANPANLGKLEPMQRAFGRSGGSAVHFLAYSIAPIAFGAFALVRGLQGVALF